MISNEILKEMLNYNPDTGIFTWKVVRHKYAGKTQIGSIAGDVKKNGYRYIGILGERYRANRLAWFYMTGMWPKNHIDHINGNVSDDSFKNLRDVTRSLNLQNQRKARSDNKSGILGVEKKDNAFIASIGINGKKKYLGSFRTANEAHQAYLKAKRDNHPGCVI